MTTNYKDYVKGSNNGQYGYGLHRALFPSNFGGPFGNKIFKLPTSFQYPTKKFGSRMLTPGGITTEGSWGFKKYGRKSKRSKIKKSRKSRKIRRRR